MAEYPVRPRELERIMGGFAPDTEMPRHSVTNQLRRELEEATTAKEAAESRLSSAVKKLEELGEEAERRASFTSELTDRSVEEGARAAFDEAVQLLRDKGTEQAGVNNSCVESPVSKKSGENLNSEGTEQGGGDG